MRKIFLIIICIILILIIIAISIIGNYFYNLALNPLSPKTIVLGNDNKTEQEELEQLENEAWLEEHSKSVIISSYDNLKLHSFELKNSEESNKWVIVIHGYTSKAKDMVNSIRSF